MSRLTDADKRHILKIIDKEQKAVYERAGYAWPGPVCEVQRARDLHDAEFLEQLNIKGDNWTDGPCTPKFILDHIDNDPENNPEDGSNFQRLCRGHNIKKNPPFDRSRRHKSFVFNNSEHYLDRERETGTESSRKGEPVWDSGGELPIVRSMEMTKNIVLRPIFEAVVKKIMRREQEAKWGDLLDAAVQDTKFKCENGQLLTVVVFTAEKWLRPLCSNLSRTAPFYIERVSGEKIVKWRREKKAAPDILPADVFEDLKNKAMTLRVPVTQVEQQPGDGK